MGWRGGRSSGEADLLRLQRRVPEDEFLDHQLALPPRDQAEVEVERLPRRLDRGAFAQVIAPVKVPVTRATTVIQSPTASWTR